MFEVILGQDLTLTENQVSKSKMSCLLTEYSMCCYWFISLLQNNIFMLKKIYKTSCLLASFFIMSGQIFAVNYTFTGSNNWTNPAAWSPSYPGTTLAAGDVLTLSPSTFCTIPIGTNIINNGTINVPANIMARIIVSSGQLLTNNGTINVLGSIDNFGSIINENVLNVTGVISNSNALVNNSLGQINLNGGTINNEPPISNIYNYGIFTNNNGNISGVGTSSFFNEGNFIGSQNGQTLNFRGNGNINNSVITALNEFSNFIFYGISNNLSNQSIFLKFGSALNYAKIDVSFANATTIGGPLNIELVNGYEPLINTSFTVLNGPYSGTFSTVNFPATPIGTTWTITYNVNNIVVTLSPQIALGAIWKDFYGELKDHTTMLNWSVEQQINCEYFSIQRSNDVLNWADVGKVYAIQSTQKNQIDYTFEDDYLQTGTIWYRLKLTDIDGSVSFSKTIELNRKGSEFTLYPNPCTNEISLLNAELELQTTYEIIDMMGVKLKNEYLLNNNRSIQVSDLKPGTYILRLKNANTLNVLTFVKN